MAADGFKESQTVETALVDDECALSSSQIVVDRTFHTVILIRMSQNDHRHVRQGQGWLQREHTTSTFSEERPKNYRSSSENQDEYRFEDEEDSD